MKRILAMWLLAVVPLAAQEINPAKSQKVDQSKVDAAIKKGVEYLKSKNADFLNTINHVDRQMSDAELVLLTYVTADVPVTDPAAKELFDDMMKRKLEATYCVSLQAMVLEEVDRVKHQHRIAQCAQFLVDNQSAQGFWGYGEPTQAVENLTPTTAPNPVATQPKGARVYEDSGVSMGKIKPKVKHRIAIKKSRDGTANDNSNSQYAALGMRACHDSGIVIPKDVTTLSIKWIRGCQKNESNVKAEGLDLDNKISGGTGPGSTVAGFRVVAAPQGWCYRDHDDHKAYGSMTAGSIGSLCIWLYINDNDEGRNKSWKRDKNVHEGLQWVNKNFSVTFNPGPYEHAGMEENSQHWYHYYLYALERVGMLYGTETIGSHEWYPEGAKELLNTQKDDGSWENARNTCFAILFLKRATRPLVATHAAGGPR
jgi:hypothetical protein